MRTWLLILPLFLAACGSADESESPTADTGAARNPPELVLKAEPVAAPSDVTPVPAVELERYLGLWYEIARIPAWFQSFCRSGTTAEYSLRDDGNITVTNGCLNSKGSLEQQIGVAGLPDPQKTSRLMVSFASESDFSEFGADYWVIALDPEYRYAVVGHPTRDYGWVLSRTASFTQADLDVVATALVAQGYDLADFELTDQAPNLAAK